MLQAIAPESWQGPGQACMVQPTHTEDWGIDPKTLGFAPHSGSHQPMPPCPSTCSSRALIASSDPRASGMVGPVSEARAWVTWRRPLRRASRSRPTRRALRCCLPECRVGRALRPSVSAGHAHPGDRAHLRHVQQHRTLVMTSNSPLRGSEGDCCAELGALGFGAGGQVRHSDLGCGELGLQHG
jgi:hypothetical protein